MISDSSPINLVSAIAGLGVFIGTGALAWVTFRSSKDARKMVEETKRLADAAALQADVSSQALEADVRPWLAPPRDREKPDEWLVEVYGVPQGYVVIQLMLKNVGSGIALLPPDAMRFYGNVSNSPLQEIGTGTAESSVIPPGHVCAFKFHTKLEIAFGQITGQPGFLDSCGRMKVTVLYRNAAAGNGAIIELVVEKFNLSESWHVVKVRYLREDDQSVIAELAPPRATRIASEREIDESQS